MNNEKNENVDLVALFWRMLYGWRKLFVFVLIGITTITVGGYIIDLNKAEKAEADSKLQLSSLQSQEVTLALNLHDTINEMENYHLNSIYMNIDSHEVFKTRIWYKVEIAPYEPKDNFTNDVSEIDKLKVDEICNYYIGYINDSQEMILGNLDFVTNSQHAFGLVNVECPSSGTICVNIIGENFEQTEKIEESIEKHIEDYKVKLSDAICNHKIEKVDKFKNVVNDSDVANKQVEYIKNMFEIKESLQTLTKTFDDEQKKYYLRKISGDENTTLKIQKAGLKVKNAVMGIFVGVVLYILYVMCEYAISYKIIDDKMIRSEYGLRILGVMNVDNKKIKRFNKIDKKIEELSGLKSSKDYDEKRLFINMKNLSAEKNTQNILVTSISKLSNLEMSIMNKISIICKENDVNVLYCENIVKEPEALDKLSYIKKVILVVRLGESRCRDFEEELRICNENKSEIVGVICMK